MLLVFCAMHMFTQMTNFNPMGVVFLWGAIKEKEGIIYLILITLNSLFPGMFNVFNPNSHSLIFPTILVNLLLQKFPLASQLFFYDFLGPPSSQAPWDFSTAPHSITTKPNLPTLPSISTCMKPRSSSSWVFFHWASAFGPDSSGSYKWYWASLFLTWTRLGPDSSRLPTGSLPSSSISVRSKLAPHKNHVLPPPELCRSQQPGMLLWSSVILTTIMCTHLCPTFVPSSSLGICSYPLIPYTSKEKFFHAIRLDYNEIFVHVAKMVTINTLLSVVVVRKREIHYMDVHNAFLHAICQRRCIWNFP